MELQEILITRVFDAPPELVFSEWTYPEALKRWWGPKGFTVPFCKVDPRTGGIFHFCMRSFDGQNYCNKGIYTSLAEPRQIAFTNFFVDVQGNQVQPSYYGFSRDWPEETSVIVDLEEYQGKTRLTLRHSLPAVSGSERDLCRQGWDESLDKLEEELANVCSESGVC